MTKSKKFLMIMLTLVVSVAGYAQTEIDGIYYNLDYIDYKSLNTGVAEVTHGDTKYSGDVVIPEKLDNLLYRTEKYSVYKDYTVTRIGSDAFWACLDLNSVTIPNSVTSIGDGAFLLCPNLTSVTIPNSVTSIEASAFSMCTSLTSITIPNSITSIKDGTFFGCQSLTSITIPNSVTSIEKDAFKACISLTSVAISNSVTSIGKYAFVACTSLTSVAIPNSVTSIGESAFQNCSALKSVILPESLTSFDKDVFKDCNSLITVVNLSKTPQNIPDGTFSTYGTLHVLPGCKAAYEAADVWKNFTIVEDADQPAEVIAVNDLIAAIGKVENTEESKAKITAARSAYDALTKEQQALVKNFNALVDAENAYKQFETTGIASVETKDSNKNGKYIENGNIVIVKNGKKYNINGQAE